MKKPQSKAEKCLWEALADVTHDSMAKRTMNITLDGINGNQSNSSGSTKNNSGNAASNPDEPNALSRLEKFISGAFKKIKGDKD